MGGTEFKCAVFPRKQPEKRLLLFYFPDGGVEYLAVLDKDGCRGCAARYGEFPLFSVEAEHLQNIRKRYLGEPALEVLVPEGIARYSPQKKQLLHVPVHLFPLERLCHKPVHTDPEPLDLFLAFGKKEEGNPGCMGVVLQYLEEAFSLYYRQVEIQYYKYRGFP